MSLEDSSVSLVKKFFELNPADAAHSLEALGEEKAASILIGVSPELSSRAFNSIDPHFGARLLEAVPQEMAVQILSKIEVTRAAELILSIQRQENREKFLELLDPAHADQIRKLTTYPEDTAGRIMTPTFFAFSSQLKVGEAIQKLRSMARKKVPVSYIYVTDQDNRLSGVLNMRELVLADGSARLDSIMIPNVFSVEASMDREKVVQALSGRPFVSVPVVDRNNHLLGTIKTDELIASAQEEATEDIQKMFGAGGDEHVFSPIPFSIKKRLLWLNINLVTAFLAAFVVGLFEPIIAQITVLAVLLPIVASQGGNSGAQSLAVVMRGLVLREVEPSLARRVIVKEGLLGLINGILVGVVAAAAAWAWNGNVYLGAVIGFAMVVNMVFAGIAGSGIPILLQALGRDPAQSSNIILTTITDVVGFFVYLSLAVLFKPLLLS